jgi:hypothetical protein
MSPYLKSAGIIAVGVVVLTALEVWWAFQAIALSGSGGLGAVSVGVSEIVPQALLLTVAAWAFIYWRRRRRRRAARP